MSRIDVKKFVFVSFRMGLVPALLYFVLFVVLTYPAITKFSTHFYSDNGDGFQNVWNIWWVKRAITVLHQSPWHTQYLHFPYGVSLLAHTLNPFNGFLAIPLSQFLDAVQTFNTVLILAFVLGGVTTFILAYDLTAAYFPSLAAGFIFTFSNYHFMHAQGHLQLVSLEWIPLFILLWLKLLLRPTLVTAIAAAFVLLLVILCDYYYFFYCVVAGVIILVWHAFHQRKGLFFFAKPPYFVPFAAFSIFSLATSGALAASLLLLNLHDPLQGGHAEEVFSLDLLAPFIYGAHWRFASLTQRYWDPLGNIHEHSVYLGFSVIILLILAWRQRKAINDARVTLFFLILLIFFVLALGPYLHVVGKRILNVPLPYFWIVWAFPPLKFSGMPVRMIVMVILSAAVLSAYSLKLLFSSNSRTAKVCAALLLVLLLIEDLPSPLPTTAPALPKYISVLRQLPGEDGVLDTDPTVDISMMYQTFHEKPIAFGTVSRNPLSVELKDQKLRSVIKQNDFARLWHQYKLRYMVTSDPSVKDFAKTFGEPGATWEIWTDGKISLFDLSKFKFVSFDELESIPDTAVEVEGDWIKDGYYPSFERPPSNIEVMGSWVKSDSDTGILRLGPFRTGSHEAIALLVATGPVAKGLSISVVEEPSEQVIAELSSISTFPTWRIWKIPLSRHDMQLKVIAKDQGAEWGEWLAIGKPQFLKVR